jgi:hypothetical protein
MTIPLPVRATPATLSADAASAALAALGALHISWGLGSRWPLRSRAELADSVVGRDTVPGPGACFVVGSLLGTAAALVAGEPRRWPAVSRTGARGVVAVLTVRGVLGLLGRTDLVSPGSSSPRFRRLDRRLYSPLCLVIAALSRMGGLSGSKR